MAKKTGKRGKRGTKRGSRSSKARKSTASRSAQVQKLTSAYPKWLKDTLRTRPGKRKIAPIGAFGRKLVLVKRDGSHEVMVGRPSEMVDAGFDVERELTVAQADALQKKGARVSTIVANRACPVAAHEKSVGKDLDVGDAFERAKRKTKRKDWKEFQYNRRTGKAVLV